MAVFTNSSFLVAQTPFISEIYFYSGDTGADEAIEIAGSTGSSLEGWQLLLYDGATGMVYDEHIFGENAIFPYNATLEEQDYGTIVKYYGTDGIQDGLDEGDGLALLNPERELVEFWSYGGSFVALNGLAMGQVSENIGSPDPIVTSNGFFSYNRRCYLPFSSIICGPNDQPYLPHPREIMSLEFWLEYLGGFYKDKTYYCGTYIKSEQAEDALGNLFYDRFGNSYSLKELEEDYLKSQKMDCADLQKFNVLFEIQNYNGTTYPTAEHRMVICEVFSYLEELITTPSTGGTVDIKIVYNLDLIGSDVIGVGSSQYRNECGIGHSIVREQLYNAASDLDPTIPHGFIQLNPSINYFTGLEEPYDIATDEYDLYTIVLHEILHAMGFLSQVGADGSSIGNFYTLWDLNLLNPTMMPMIQATSGTDECCMEYEFNDMAFPIMPNDIMEGCGDVLFNIPNFPAINGEYNHTFPSDPNEFDQDDHVIASNMLSHLDARVGIGCGSEPYVMHYNIQPGALHSGGFPNIRRTLTSTELGILCRLGYELNDCGETCPDCENDCFECTPECLIIIKDDGPFFPQAGNPILEITFSSLVANDYVSVDDYEIIFPENCGDNELLAPMEMGEKVTIDVENLGNGSYFLCYTISACDGRACQTGMVTIIVFNGDSVGNLANDCEENNCNLICNGDFEAYFPRKATFYPQSGVANFTSPSNDIETGSVDILYDPVGQNNILTAVNFLGQGEKAELVYFPLNVPIPDGCTAAISFDAHITHPNTNFYLFGFSGEPCSSFYFEPICQLDQITNTNDCPDLFQFCMEEFAVNEIATGVINTVPTIFGFADYPFSEDYGLIHAINTDFAFDNIVYNWINNTGHSLDYLGFYVEPMEDDFNILALDNIAVTTDCINTATITHEVVMACLEEQIQIDFEICLEGTLNTSSDITIEVGLPNISGISYSSFNPIFDNGIATLEEAFPSANCPEISLFLDVAEGYSDGSIITLPLEVLINNGCLTNDGLNQIEVTLEDCCPNDPISGFETQGGGCNEAITFTSVADSPDWEHFWDFDNGETSTLANPPTQNFEPGIYTIVHTVSDDCTTATTQGTVEIFSIPIADFSFEQEPCNSTLEFTSFSTDEDWEHVWLVNNNIEGTEANFSFNFEEGNFDVEHQVTNACGDASSSQIISMDLTDCIEVPCADDVHFIIGLTPNSITNLQDFIDDQNLSGVALSNTSLLINGTLDIDQPYSFEHCHFIMGPSATIVVSSPHVEIYGDGYGSSSITGCEYLWNGIQVIGSDNALSLRGTYVADAQAAVQVESKVDLQLIYNTFDKNLVGLYTPPQSDQLTGLDDVRIFFNFFECTGDLKPEHPDFPLSANLPSPQNVSYAGMILNTLGGISIGLNNYSTSSNTFRNMANGIIAKRTDMSIYSARFFNLGQEGNYPEQGYGILLNGKGQMLTQRGIQGGASPSFQNCRYGIWANHSVVDIQDNYMFNVDQGITVQGSNSQDIYIDNNNLYCNESGIAVREAGQTAELEILNNFIDVGHPMAIGTNMYGIEISDSAVPDFSTKFKGVIEGNVIDAYQREGGIGILNSKNIQVINNDIEINDPFKHTGGIEVTGSSLIEVRDGNTITRGDIFNVNQLTDLEVFGIRAENSASCTYCCNTVEMINYGVVFDGTTSPSSLGGTQFRDHFQGLRLTNGTSINEEGEAQTHNGNCWSGEYVQWGAIHEGDFNDIGGSQFIVNPQEDRCFFPELRSPEEGWFSIDNGLTFKCGTNPCDQLLVKRELTKTDSLRAAGVETVENVVEEHELTRRLYRNIESLIEYGIVVPEAMNFYNMHSTTSVGQFRTIERGIRDLWQLDNLTLETLHGYNEEMAILFAEIAEKDNALQNASGEDSLQLVADKRLLYEELNNISNNRNDLLNVIQADRESTITTLLALNNAITVNEIYEVNEKTVNEIYLNTVAQQHLEFTDEQIATLESIAYQCPKDGGYSVYRAQSLLRLTGNSYDFNYNCENLELRNSNTKNVKNEEELNLSISPNPVRDIVEIKLSEAFDKNVNIQIIDMYGRIIEERVLLAYTNTMSLPVHTFPNGVYWLRFNLARQGILADKIIINK